MTPHQAAARKVSLRRALKPRYINLSITTLDFFFPLGESQKKNMCILELLRRQVSITVT